MWWSIVYSIGQITVGLLLHPYQTMQSLVKDKVFIWMSLLPTGVLALITMMWRFVVVPVVQSVFSCEMTGFWGCQWLPLAGNVITFFCFYWQIVLFYLLFRFTFAWKRTRF